MEVETSGEADGAQGVKLEGGRGLRVESSGFLVFVGSPEARSPGGPRALGTAAERGAWSQQGLCWGTTYHDGH